MPDPSCSPVGHANRRRPLARLETWLTSILASRRTSTKSALFTRLPPEIRRQILRYAFGDWTVHIGLKFRRVRRGFRRRTQDTWTWKGCFCHQKAVTWHNPPHFEGWRRAWSDDRCFEDVCMQSKCFRSFDCHIGIMGWLLTCRQAYLEGIDVLYGTNTIHFHGFVLLRQLPDLLSRSRLESISKVELTWHLNPWLDQEGTSEPIMDGPSSRNIPTMEAFISTAESLPQILPNVKYLYISLVGSLIPFNVSITSAQTYQSTEELLKVVDRSVRKMGNLAECRIALPTSCFYMWKFRAPHIWEDAFRDSLDLGGVWRQLPPPPKGGEDEGGHANRDGDEQAVARGAKGRGYWVCHGKWDLPLPFLF